VHFLMDSEFAHVVDPHSNITFVDVLDLRRDIADRTQLFPQLKSVHRRHFPDYEYVVDQWASILDESVSSEHIIKHAWLAFVGNEPCGQFIIDVNLTRESILIHFVAMDKEVRRTLPRYWLRDLLEAIVEYCQVEAQQHSVQLEAAMAESYPEYLWKWAELGYTDPPVGYQEPVHGAQWRDHGEPEFFPLTAFVRMLDSGSGRADSEKITSVVRAFLLDAYDLPEENPVVSKILDRCSSL
jgi:hypothetical protein